MTAPGLLLVISGPSGTGKGTICRELIFKNPQVQYSVSATTRPPRAGEIHGTNYFFLTKEQFDVMREKGELIEWAQVYDNFYGTPRRAIEEALEQGIDIILEIDIQGAMQVKKMFPHGVFIFILPPSREELRSRIIGRGTDDMETIEKRLRCLDEELSHLNNYDYVVVNDLIPEAVARIEAIIKAEKCRASRNCLYVD